MSARYQERLASIEKILLIEKQTIDLTELRQSCIYGIPDLLRPLGWRLLLNYLPTDRQCWKEFLRLQRANYDALVDQLIVQPGSVAPQNDHPLSDSSDSEWASFFSDNQILSQIDKDVRRLCPEIQFFQMKTQYPHKSAVHVNLSERVTGKDLEEHEVVGIDKGRRGSRIQSRKRASEQYRSVDTKGDEVHWQVLERILFIYAKLNPGVKYVQGMNEVVGPIYYVLASDRDEEWAEWAEADAFFCFQQLMSEVKDNFIKTLDSSSVGIESSMSSFHALLASFDPQLHGHLVNELAIKPQFYAFRWLSLLLSQEFPLPDVITIWDSLFADVSRFSLLPFVCLAMLENKREDLLAGDFADCLRLLQNYPATDGAHLVCLALSLREGGARRPSTNSLNSSSSSSLSSTIKGHRRTLSDRLRQLGGMLKK